MSMKIDNSSGFIENNGAQFDSFIENEQIKPELECAFRKKISEVEKDLLSLSSSVEVQDIKCSIEIQSSLLELQGLS